MEDKLMMKAEEQGVLVVLRSSTYKSQRCNKCGLVCKSNRKGKKYCCNHCGLVEDADLNAAKNNEIDLVSLPYDITALKLNVEGFFWGEEKLTYFNGQEFRVPDLIKDSHI